MRKKVGAKVRSFLSSVPHKFTKLVRLCESGIAGGCLYGMECASYAKYDYSGRLRKIGEKDRCQVQICRTVQN